MTEAKTRFYIQTYGCQMNVADSDRMAALLEQSGAEPVSEPESADIILLNTCSVRERPEHKVYSRLGELRRLKQRNPGVLIGVCGCQAQREGEALLERAPWVDLVVGTANVDRVPELVRQVRSTGKPVVALEMPERGKPAWLSPEPHMTADLQDLVPAGVRQSRLKAFVPIILVTARTAVADVVAGLEHLADHRRADRELAVGRVHAQPRGAWRPGRGGLAASSPPSCAWRRRIPRTRRFRRGGRGVPTPGRTGRRR